MTKPAKLHRVYIRHKVTVFPEISHTKPFAYLYHRNVEIRRFFWKFNLPCLERVTRHYPACCFPMPIQNSDFHQAFYLTNSKERFSLRIIYISQIDNGDLLQ